MKESYQEHTAFLILAGGKSTRMGTDKADLRLKDKSFLHILQGKADQLGFQEILISGYHGIDSNIMTMPDQYPGMGPLSGLHTGFLSCKRKHCFVISVDVPLIHISIIDQLASVHMRQQKPITLLYHKNSPEPLIGVYDTSLFKQIEQDIKKELLSVTKFIHKIGYNPCVVTKYLETIANINTPSDYQLIDEIWQR